MRAAQSAIGFGFFRTAAMLARAAVTASIGRANSMGTDTVCQNFRLMVPLAARGGRLRAAVSARAIKDDTNGQYF
jgi:hypothetical protein